MSVCFFGDGTTNIGAFHEALNFAAVWKLPVIFVCENNLYMEYTPIADVTAVPHPAADRASAYGLETHHHRRQRRRRGLSHGDEAPMTRRAQGDGPSLIECMTYRHSGHSRADPAKYRPEGELEKLEGARSGQDLSRAALEFGIDAIGDRRSIDADVERDVDDATESLQGGADAAAWTFCTTDVYADGGFAWRN